MDQTLLYISLVLFSFSHFILFYLEFSFLIFYFGLRQKKWHDVTVTVIPSCDIEKIIKGFENK